MKGFTWMFLKRITWLTNHLASLIVPLTWSLHLVSSLGWIVLQYEQVWLQYWQRNMQLINAACWVFCANYYADLAAVGSTVSKLWIHVKMAFFNLFKHWIFYKFGIIIHGVKFLTSDPIVTLFEIMCRLSVIIFWFFISNQNKFAVIVAQDLFLVRMCGLCFCCKHFCTFFS